MPGAPKRFQFGGTGKRWEHRDVAHRRLYNYKWEKRSRAFRREHPLCERCKTLGLVRPAQVVDHVVPHRGDETLFWDEPGNWQSLCVECHSIATYHYDGAFGQPVRPKPNYRRGETDPPDVLAELERNSPSITRPT